MLDYHLTSSSEALSCTCRSLTEQQRQEGRRCHSADRGTAFLSALLCGGRPTVFVHLVNHLLQLLRCRVLAEHSHHLAQLLGADAAVLGVLHKDVEGGLELCTGKQFQLSAEKGASCTSRRWCLL